MTDANAQDPQHQHWTEGFPHLADQAATLLGVDVATVARHNKVVPGGFHVWTPGRGGAQAIVGFDGSAYVRESCFTQAQLVEAFHAGHRNDANAATPPVNHAASAVASMVGILRGGQAQPATPTGPSEAELAELVGSGFERTTSDEIAERLRARGKGAFVVVGVDRAHGPGHWYVAYFDGEEVLALDPIANGRTAWPPPAADAVRWWADGTPTTAPARVVLDARSATGRRVWTETTPFLAPTAQSFLDWVVTLPAEKVVAGYQVWHGFWWVVLAESGDDLRVAVTDLTKDGTSTLTWDVDPMLDTYRQQREMVAFCKVGAKSTRFTETVLVYNDVYDAPEMYVERTSPAGDGASGWVVKSIAAQPRGGLLPVPAHELYRRAPHLVRYLSLPEGFRAVWAKNRTNQIWNPDGELVWDADARDAAKAADADEASASVGAPTSGTTRPRGSVAYEAARDALDDRAMSRERVLAAAHGLRDAFVRNEHVIGLLPGDAEQVLVDTYRRADAGGADAVSREAATSWVREAYFRRLPLAAEAAERVDRLAEDDPDGGAHVLRGWMRYNGYGFAQDAVAAVADHEEAARRGSADALFELSVLTATGQGTPVDEARSRALLEQAADAGHPRALYNLAAEHATGRGRPRDSARALELYLAAGDRGNGRAAFTAGIMMLTGDGSLPDPARAGRAFALAEDLGFDVRDAAAQFPPQLAEQVVEALAAG
ncbi:SEL1-like repeat protein [Cellulosimicrobium cellulans]|uniref:tetratricopeptide repeat protein n=1 Tax=Cellulosimicrobium cellulans TaxID=1710 RepID=UPI001EDBE243|nr:tetratricopeptide repeat protein [Cellulosimicrobium cellulans]UKJ63342.1 SEL1-like repeat protein [Cellulosimicrobium cellulans]